MYAPRPPCAVQEAFEAIHTATVALPAPDGGPGSEIFANGGFGGFGGSGGDDDDDGDHQWFTADNIDDFDFGDAAVIGDGDGISFGVGGYPCLVARWCC